jgi:uncharacterized protein (TIGR01777 family)
MNKSIENILIAGGTGLIGRKLASLLKKANYDVFILSRNPKQENEYYWNPDKQELDEKALEDVTVLISLCGAGIADERWTKNRKKILEDSRINTNRFLHTKIDQMPNLKQFICASGINAYRSNKTKVYTETDAFGEDFLPQLVKKWEASAQVFDTKVNVALVRTAVVLAIEGGAYPRLAKLTQLGLGSALGRGDQPMPWIHIDDLTGIYLHIIRNQLTGCFNAVTSCDSNKQFMQALAMEMKKPFFLPNVPAWVLKLALGEMSSLLLEGVCASHQNIAKTGYFFQYPDLKSALLQLQIASK